MVSRRREKRRDMTVVGVMSGVEERVETGSEVVIIDQSGQWLWR